MNRGKIEGVRKMEEQKNETPGSWGKGRRRRTKPEAGNETVSSVHSTSPSTLMEEYLLGRN